MSLLKGFPKEKKRNFMNQGIQTPEKRDQNTCALSESWNIRKLRQGGRKRVTKKRTGTSKDRVYEFMSRCLRRPRDPRTMNFES